MYSLRPIFPGRPLVQQLWRMFGILGTPDENIWPGVTQMAFWMEKNPQWEKKRMVDVIPGISREGSDLLEVS